MGKCNNKHCYWNYNDSCVHEDEESYKNATPNELDCPSSLRVDFEKSFKEMVMDCRSMLNRRTFKEIREVHKLLTDQRK